jgi:2-methylcitrate dehydratase PrpD
MVRVMTSYEIQQILQLLVKTQKKNVISFLHIDVAAAAAAAEVSG